MKKLLFILSVVFASQMFAKPAVVVSIVPQKTFVEKIAKDLVDVTLMVTPGSSPHAYEPKASQMIALSKADVYFSVGVEFEEVWLAKFKSQTPRLKFVDMSQGIQKIGIRAHHHGAHKDEHKTEALHENLDPHIWTSPKNVAVMAKIIFETLVQLDPQNKPLYKANFDLFLEEIRATDKEIRAILKETQPKAKFMVFHPSWGYFAKEYNLTQFAVEVEGKNPKPKEMIMLIKEAKEEKVKAIFTQPEFSDKSASIIAKEANVRIEKISPLSPLWSQNLINMAKAIANK